MEAWENLEVISKKHIDLRVPNFIYVFLLILFENILIKAFSKYVHFNLDFVKFMVVGYNFFLLPCIKFMRQIISFFFLKIFKGITQVLILKLRPLRIKYKELIVVEGVDVFTLTPSNNTYNSQVFPI